MKIDKLNYVSKAEDVIKSLITKNRNGRNEIRLTTSKIRNLLSMVSELYSDAIHNKDNILSTELQSRVQYLKMRIAYEAGREKDVKNFVEKANLFEVLSEVGDNKQNLILFCNYFEALVAYHKYYGGRD